MYSVHNIQNVSKTSHDIHNKSDIDVVTTLIILPWRERSTEYNAKIFTNIISEVRISSSSKCTF